MEVNISNLNHFSAFHGNFAIYTDTMGKSGIINRQGEIVLRADEFEIATFIEGTTFAFQNTDGSRKELLFDAATGEKKYYERPAVERKPMEQNFLVAPNRIAFQEEGLFGIKVSSLFHSKPPGILSSKTSLTNAVAWIKISKCFILVNTSIKNFEQCSVRSLRTMLK